MYVKIYLKLLLNEEELEMNFKDRGNKKWTSLMLVEHRKRLKELKEHEDDREKPTLDDQEMAVINFKLQQAIDNNLEVKINYYESKRFKTIIGEIKKVDINRKEIVINEEKIKFEDLIGIRLK